MQSDREKTLAVRWGLVGLGLLCAFAVRLLRVFLDEVAHLRVRVDSAALGARMSQLKPRMFKMPWLGGYAVVLVSLIAITIALLMVIGIRDAMRAED